MPTDHFVVKYVPVKNCFVQIPSAWYCKLSSQVNAIKLSYNGKEFYLSAIQSQLNSSEFLCISATFGKCLQIEEGAEVNVSHILDPPTLTTIYVRPFNSEDWQIVNLQAHKIQSTLLDQINIVSPNQPIVIWLSKYLNVTLLVESISPSFMYGKLENYTEVHVQDATVHKIPADTITKKITSHSCSKENETDCDIFLKGYRHQNLQEIFRVCLTSMEEQYKINERISETEISSPHNIFMRANQLKKLFPNRENYLMMYGKIKSVIKDKENSNLNLMTDSQMNILNIPSDMFVNCTPVEDFFNEQFLEKNVDDKNIWISECLRRDLNIQLGSKIYIEPVNIVENPITFIEVFPTLKCDLNTLKDYFKNYVKQHSIKSDLILTQNTKISLVDKKCRIKFHPESIPYALLNDKKVKNMKIQITERENSQANENESQQVEKFNPSSVYMNPLEKILKESIKILQMCLNPQEYTFYRENILICGDIGTGKTIFLNLLKDKIENPPNFIYTKFIDCIKLKGKKVDIVSKFFTAAMDDCMYYQPSVLFLDNLECITSYPNDNEENSLDTINATKISEYLNSLITMYQSFHLISVVATCTQMDKLGSGLRPTRGLHIFQTILNSPTLSAQQRIEFLKFNLKNKVEMSNKINWFAYSSATEGWVFQDLADLCEKSIFLTWKCQPRSRLILEDEDLSNALRTIKPLSLYGVSLLTDGKSNGWNDIGGLEEVKESLKQLLQWPLIYTGLFAKAPVRHQSGILLYGMPGTGKTMLAGAIAKECRLNFINIKGPELLSKYIGASEEAVRNIFEKAQRIKPCIIFFDEFESLAPRRGHDSTGVTDRVVNQLLTQFDGVEGREGVAIVAASSRPDLLDPALLRPGRLDKSLLCPLPDEQTRAKILDILCKRHSIDVKDLDLVLLVKMTSGFTGADLNAVFTQARLNAVEEHCEKSRENESLEGVRIGQEMLVRSVEDTQPSLTTGEISTFNRIYNRFLNGDNFSEQVRKNQKTTLA